MLISMLISMLILLKCTWTRNIPRDIWYHQLNLYIEYVLSKNSIASLSLFYRYYRGKCSTGLSNSVPSVRVFERETWLSACSHPYTLAVPRCRTKSYTNSFFPTLWNSLPGACFPSYYDLSRFKRNLNSHIQILWVYLLFKIFLLL